MVQNRFYNVLICIKAEGERSILVLVDLSATFIYLVLIVRESSLKDIKYFFRETTPIKIYLMFKNFAH